MMTLEDFKKNPVITKELQDAIKNYSTAKLEFERIAPIVQAYKEKIMLENEWVYPTREPSRRDSLAGQRMLNPEHTYMLSDEEAQVFYDACDAEAKKLGYNLKPGYCPKLVANTVFIEARRDVINAGEYITGINAQKLLTLERIEKAVDILIKLSTAEGVKLAKS